MLTVKIKGITSKVNQKDLDKLLAPFRGVKEVEWSLMEEFYDCSEVFIKLEGLEEARKLVFKVHGEELDGVKLQASIQGNAKLSSGNVDHNRKNNSGYQLQDPLMETINKKASNDVPEANLEQATLKENLKQERENKNLCHNKKNETNKKPREKIEKEKFSNQKTTESRNKYPIIAKHLGSPVVENFPSKRVKDIRKTRRNKYQKTMARLAKNKAEDKTLVAKETRATRREELQKIASTLKRKRSVNRNTNLDNTSAAHKQEIQSVTSVVNKTWSVDNSKGFENVRTARREELRSLVAVVKGQKTMGHDNQLKSSFPKHLSTSLSRRSVSDKNLRLEANLRQLLEKKSQTLLQGGNQGEATANDVATHRNLREESRLKNLWKNKSFKALQATEIKDYETKDNLRGNNKKREEELKRLLKRKFSNSSIKDQQTKRQAKTFVARDNVMREPDFQLLRRRKPSRSLVNQEQAILTSSESALNESLCREQEQEKPFKSKTDNDFLVKKLDTFHVYHGHGHDYSRKGKQVKSLVKNSSSNVLVNMNESKMRDEDSPTRENLKKEEYLKLLLKKKSSETLVSQEVDNVCYESGPASVNLKKREEALKRLLQRRSSKLSIPEERNRSPLGADMASKNLAKEEQLRVLLRKRSSNSSIVEKDYHKKRTIERNGKVNNTRSSRRKELLQVNTMVKRKKMDESSDRSSSKVISTNECRVAEKRLTDRRGNQNSQRRTRSKNMLILKSASGESSMKEYPIKTVAKKSQHKHGSLKKRSRTSNTISNRREQPLRENCSATRKILDDRMDRGRAKPVSRKAYKTDKGRSRDNRELNVQRKPEHKEIQVSKLVLRDPAKKKYSFKKYERNCNRRDRRERDNESFDRRKQVQRKIDKRREVYQSAKSRDRRRGNSLERGMNKKRYRSRSSSYYSYSSSYSYDSYSSLSQGRRKRQIAKKKRNTGRSEVR
eukprot:maker-scaffold_3-snap-gene-14.47-mRNA-1 protein AED:0.41 eAED:0.41 QI:0/1/0.5/1/1/1/2/70/953